MYRQALTIMSFIALSLPYVLKHRVLLMFHVDRPVARPVVNKWEGEKPKNGKNGKMEKNEAWAVMRNQFADCLWRQRFKRVNLR